MEQENPKTPVALIVGVTGMVGVALSEALKKPTTIGGPWTVYGVSRRPLPTWFPSSQFDKYFIFDALDKETTHKILSPLSTKITHLFWLALRHDGLEKQNIYHNSTMLSNVLNSLSSSPDSKLSHVTLQTGLKHYYGPIFDPTISAQIIPHDPPFKEDYPRLPCINFYYVLEDIVAASYSKSFTYSIHRSSIIMGASTRSYFNGLLTLSVYALVCKHENHPFRYFGNKYNWEHLWQVSDANLVAKQHIWAATTEKAKNQAFNCTNGDVFTWKSFWRVLCDVFDVEFVEFDEKDEFDCVDFMKDKGEVWDKIVKENGLYETKLENITHFVGATSILKLEIQHVCIMNKGREFGFHEYANTLVRIKSWVERLRQLKILP